MVCPLLTMVLLDFHLMTLGLLTFIVSYLFILYYPHFYVNVNEKVKQGARGFNNFQLSMSDTSSYSTPCSSHLSKDQGLLKRNVKRDLGQGAMHVCSEERTC